MTRCTALIIVTCSLLAGCKRAAVREVYLEALHAEKRQLEDELYALQYDYDILERELAACERKSEPVLRKAQEPMDEGEPDIGIPDIEMPPTIEVPGNGLGDIDPAPRLKLALFEPTPAIGSGVLADSAVRFASAQFDVSTKDGNPFAGALSLRSPKAIDHIYLNPRMTGGKDYDGKPGDDGIVVLIEPRDAEGNFRPVVGKIAIVLIDSAVEGDAGRIARWDFEPSVAAKSLRTQSLDRGFLFRLPWRKQRPENAKLHLFARYIDDAGRKLDADRQIEIKLPPTSDRGNWSVQEPRHMNASPVPAEVAEEDDGWQVAKP